MKKKTRISESLKKFAISFVNKFFYLYKISAVSHLLFTAKIHAQCALYVQFTGKQKLMDSFRLKLSDGNKFC